MAKALDPLPHHSVLDVGSGTGYFTRAIGMLVEPAVTALDPNLDWLRWSSVKLGTPASYVAGDATALPFSDAAFDHTVSVAALCFIDDQRRAVEEIVRVTRHRFVIGVLNRRSLLYRRSRGREGYAGAHWHTTSELRSLFHGLRIRSLRLRSAIQIPTGSLLARTIEHLVPSVVCFGGFLVVSGEVGGAA